MSTISQLKKPRGSNLKWTALTTENVWNFPAWHHKFCILQKICNWVMEALNVWLDSDILTKKFFNFPYAMTNEFLNKNDHIETTAKFE